MCSLSAWAAVRAVASGLTPSSAHSQPFLALGMVSPTLMDRPAYSRQLPSCFLCHLSSLGVHTQLTLSCAGQEVQGCVWENRTPGSGYLEHVLGAGWCTGSGWTRPLTRWLLSHEEGCDREWRWRGKAGPSKVSGPKQGTPGWVWKLYFSSRSSVTCYVWCNGKG